MHLCTFRFSLGKVVVSGGSERSQGKGEMELFESLIKNAGISDDMKKFKSDGGIVPCSFRIILKYFIMPSSGIKTRE